MALTACSTKNLALVRAGDLVVAHPALRGQVPAGELPVRLNRHPGQLACEVTQVSDQRVVIREQ